MTGFNISRFVNTTITNNKAIIQSAFVTFSSYWFLGGNFVAMCPLIISILLELISYIFSSYDSNKYRYRKRLSLYEQEMFLQTIPFLDSKYKVHIYVSNKEILLDFTDGIATQITDMVQEGKGYINFVIEINDIRLNGWANTDYIRFNANAHSQHRFKEIYEHCNNIYNEKLGKVRYHEFDTSPHKHCFRIMGTVPAPYFNADYYKCYDKLVKILDSWNTNMEKFKKLNSSKLGFVLHGKPGTGKTMLASAVAHYVSADLIKLSIDMQNLQLRIPPIENDKKYVLLLDDLDILFEYNRATEDNNPDEIIIQEADKKAKEQSLKMKKKELFYQLMCFLDNNIRYQNCIIFVTTNYVEKFDEALFRPGRIDYLFEFTDIPVENVRNIVKSWYNVTDESQLEKLVSLPISVVMSLIKKNLDDLNGFIEEFEIHILDKQMKDDSTSKFILEKMIEQMQK